jgi:hypothetical protein
MKVVIWAMLMLGAALAHGCAGASERENEPTWEAARVREQWPEFAAEPACLTVWVIDGDGCAVADETGEPRECVAAPDPFVLNVPDRFGTCKIGLQDCEEGRCPSQR